jgi:homoserine O-acetyltransferase
MKKRYSLIIFISLCFVFFSMKAQLPNVPSGKSDTKQQYAQLGDIDLESGQKLLGCKIGYRTFGKLNESKSNVALFLCGLANTSALLQSFVPYLVDTTKYHLILVDALSNGVSSSPSNSDKQDRLSFPQISIRDMVATEHTLLTKKLGIDHVAVVGGISMGAMQSYQWAVTYPEMMDKMVAILSTPKMSNNDLLWISTVLEAIKANPEYKNGQYKGKISIPIASHIMQLAYSTPEYISTKIPSKTFDSWYNTTGNQAIMDWNDMVRQLEAIKAHDISASTKGSMEEAAKRIQAKMLVMVNKQDHTVQYLAAKNFATLTQAEYIEIDDMNGHTPQSLPVKEVRAFLAK